MAVAEWQPVALTATRQTLRWGRNTLAGLGMVLLSFFSFYRYLYYRTYDHFLSDEAKSEVLWRSKDFPTR